VLFFSSAISQSILWHSTAVSCASLTFFGFKIINVFLWTFLLCSSFCFLCSRLSLTFKCILLASIRPRTYCNVAWWCPLQPHHHMLWPHYVQFTGPPMNLLADFPRGSHCLLRNPTATFLLDRIRTKRMTENSSVYSGLLPIRRK